MNWDTRERARIDRIPVTRLTPAQIQAVRDQLAADYERHLRNMVELQRIMAFTAEIARKRAIRAKVKPIQLPLPLKEAA